MLRCRILRDGCSCLRLGEGNVIFFSRNVSIRGAKGIGVLYILYIWSTKILSFGLMTLENYYQRFFSVSACIHLDRA